MFNRKAQVTIEAALGMIIVFVLLAATIRLLVWFTGSMIERQTAFQKSRLTKYANLVDEPNGNEDPNDYNPCIEDGECYRPAGGYSWWGIIYEEVNSNYYRPKKLNVFRDTFKEHDL